MLALVSAADAAGSAWQAQAVLAGTAVNQDGRSSSLTAPNGPSQQETMHAALRSGERGAWEVGHLQMHGTGERPRVPLSPATARPGIRVQVPPHAIATMLVFGGYLVFCDPNSGTAS